MPSFLQAGDDLLMSYLYTRFRFYKFILYKFESFVVYIIRLRLRFIKRLQFRYIRLLVFVWFRLWLRKIYNFEKLPQIGPAIIVSNHVSYYDWAVLSAVYNKKYIVFLANKDLLNRRIVSWLMRLNILIYVDKSKPDVRYFRQVINRLREGKIVVIYPEGTRSRTGKMIEPKVGFVKLALLAKAPIVPVGMKGTFEILPPQKKIPRLCKCEIFVGDAIRIEKNNPLFEDIFARKKKLDNDSLKEIAIRIMEKISDMVGQSWEGDVKRNPQEYLHPNELYSETLRE